MPRQRFSFRLRGRKKRGAARRNSSRRKLQRQLQRGGVLPIVIPLIAAGISAAGGIGASAVHAAISKQ